VVEYIQMGGESSTDMEQWVSKTVDLLQAGIDAAKTTT
jgi:hypothetical protein